MFVGHNAELFARTGASLRKTDAAAPEANRADAVDLQGNNLKVRGETRSPRALWAPTPNPWKQEGTKSCEKRRISKGLCGFALPQNPYSGFRSGHTQLR